MNLPNITTPEFKLQLPSNNETVFFRPFLVKEEKALLIALESNDPDEIENVVINTIKNCLKYEKNIDELPYFDIEYIFLQLRSKSIDNIVNFKLNHRLDVNCNHRTDYKLNLNQINVVFEKNHSKNIKLTDSVGVIMRYPSIKMLKNVSTLNTTSNIDKIFSTVASCIESVYDSDSVYENFTIEEIKTWLENLNKTQFQKIVDFFEFMPSLSYTIDYTCEKCGTRETIPLKGLQSFFM